MTQRIVWQYWETRGTKPRFIDGLRDLAKKNSGLEIVLVTPENLRSYLPHLPESIFQIEEMAHKADMIRTMLVVAHGGMWLDSDAIVLRDLNWLFDLLEKHEFVGFNDGGKLTHERPWIRVNCFLSRAGGTVVSEWVRRQHAKFPQTIYEWEEIGSALLNPLCVENADRVKILPFETISPIGWDEVEKFKARNADVDSILRKCSMVMLSNHTLAEREPALQNMTVEEIAAGDYLLSAIMEHAMHSDPPHPVESDYLARLSGTGPILFRQPGRPHVVQIDRQPQRRAKFFFSR